MSKYPPQCSSDLTLMGSTLYDTEAVLCLLLAKYTFAPSGKKISWNLSNVRFPTVGDDPKPSMPMKVALYKSSRSSA